MKELIKHWIHNNMDEIVANSRKHCHAKNVHSIVFVNKPGQRVRLFYAECDHDLWKNHPDLYTNESMSVGFHAHHCDLTIYALSKNVFNWNVETIEGLFDYDLFGVKKYKYESHLNGQGRFKYIDNDAVVTQEYTRLNTKEVLYLPANQLHTIYVPRGERAGWFVFEGKEDPNYDSVCYSNTDLSKFEFDDYYKPMTEQDVINAINSVKIK